MYDLDGRLLERGYHEREVNWIKQMLYAYQNGHDRQPFKSPLVQQCNHTGGTYQYTKSIVDKIHKIGIDNFEKQHNHANFSTKLF